MHQLLLDKCAIFGIGQSESLWEGWGSLPKVVGSWERIRQGELKNALFSPLTTKTQRVGARDIRLQRMPYGMKGELLCDVDRSLGVLVYA